MKFGQFSERNKMGRTKQEMRVMAKENPARHRELSRLGNKKAQPALAEVRKEKATIKGLNKDRAELSTVEAALERARVMEIKDGDVLPPDPAVVEALEEEINEREQ